MKLWLVGSRTLDESDLDTVPWTIIGLFSSKAKARNAAIDELTYPYKSLGRGVKRQVVFIGPLVVDKSIVGKNLPWPGAFNIGEKEPNSPPLIYAEPK